MLPEKKTGESYTLIHKHIGYGQYRYLAFFNKIDKNPQFYCTCFLVAPLSVENETHTDRGKRELSDIKPVRCCVKMATFFGEVLPEFSRAVDDDEEDDAQFAAPQ